MSRFVVQINLHQGLTFCVSQDYFFFVGWVSGSGVERFFVCVLKLQNDGLKVTWVSRLDT